MVEVEVWPVRCELRIRWSETRMKLPRKWLPNCGRKCRRQRESGQASKNIPLFLFYFPLRRNVAVNADDVSARCCHPNNPAAQFSPLFRSFLRLKKKVGCTWDFPGQRDRVDRNHTAATYLILSSSPPHLRFHLHHPSSVPSEPWR